MSHVLGFPAHPDHRHAARCQQRRQGCALGVCLALVNHPQSVVIDAGVEHQPGEALLNQAPAVQSGGTEDVEHVTVLGQGVGDQPCHAGGGGPGPHLLQQEHADASLLVVVVDEQRYLGLLGRRLSHPATPTTRPPISATTASWSIGPLAGKATQIAVCRTPVQGEEAEVDSPIAHTGGELAKASVVVRGNGTDADDMAVARKSFPADARSLLVSMS